MIPNPTTEKLFVAIDANAIIHRAFHAYPPTLKTTKGLQVNAVYGFTVMLLEVLKKYHPEYIVCAFDTAKPTFRHTKYTEYKATRKPTDQSLVDQFPLVEQVLKAFNIPILKKEGYEADDLLGTLAKYVQSGKWSQQNLDMLIVSGDRDLLQLISDRVSICLPQGSFKTLTAYNRIKAYERYGLYPEQIIDYKGIVGDASDNIPGVKGIGEKTALELLNKYGSMNEIYKNLTDLKPRIQQILGEGIEQAEFSRDLATIETNVSMEISLEQCLMRDFKRKDVQDIFIDFEFRSLIDKIPGSVETSEQVVAQTGQLDMFSMYKSENSGVDAGSGGLQEAPRVSGEGCSSLFSTDTIPELASVGSYEFEDYSGIDWDVIKEKLKAVKDASGAYLLYQNGSLFFGFVLGERVFGGVIHKFFERGGICNGFTTLLTELSCETSLFGWEEYVSRVIAVRNNADSSIFDGASTESRVNTDSLLSFSLAVFDSQLVAHYLSSGKRDYSLSALMVDYGIGVLPQEISRSVYKDYFVALVKLSSCLKNNLLRHKTSDFMSYFGQRVNSVLEKLNIKVVSPEVVSGEEKATDFERAVVKYIEPRISVLLGQMENVGLQIDIDKLQSLKADLVKAVDKSKKEVFDSVGHEFNLNSPKQLSDVLYNELRLPQVRGGKAGMSTREGLLVELKGTHPAIESILTYRELSKMLSTYVDAFLEIIEPQVKRGETPVIRTDFKQLGTSSGRLSSTNPNLQNLPARSDWAPRFREIFVARKGKKYVSIDYSQIEFRIMAEISDDNILIGDFVNGKDIHRATASRIFGLAETEVTPAQRSAAKTVNFGILYGQTPFGLSRQLQISSSEAAKYIKDYFGTYKGVAKYIDRAGYMAEKMGYVESIFGRRRYVSGLDSQNRAIKNAAIREAINMPIQGSAADLMKLSMIGVDILIRQEYNEKVDMLLQVHDELVFEADENVADEFGKKACEVMKNIVELKVPLEVHMGIGKDLAEIK